MGRCKIESDTTGTVSVCEWVSPTAIANADSGNLVCPSKEPYGPQDSTYKP